MKMTKLFTGLGAVLMVLALAACQEKGPAEKAGEKIDNAMENAGDKIEDATDKAGEKMEDMGDKVEDATDKK